MRILFDWLLRSLHSFRMTEEEGIEVGMTGEGIRVPQDDDQGGETFRMAREKYIVIQKG